MPTVLITGANRGLGLEFSRQYAEAGWRVLACCRNPEGANALASLADRQPAVSLHRLDLERWDEIDALAETLSGQSLDLLVNNAGIYGGAVENRFGGIDYSLWTRAFRVNCEAAVRMAEAFLPHLGRGTNALIVAVTSLMGSMADNTSGGAIIYRSSKAALNAAMKSLSLDLRSRKIGVLLLHPGWVKTDMGGANAPTSPEDSVAGMRQVVANFRPEDTGRFIDFRGKELPW